MLRCGQSVLTSNVELIKAHIMQEHIDAAKVVSRDIDFLPVKAVSDGILTEDLFCFQKQRTRTTRRVYVPADFDTIEKAFSGG